MLVRALTYSLISVFMLTGCAGAPKTAQKFETQKKGIAGVDRGVRMEVVGARPATEGWIEYQIEVTNNSRAPRSGFSSSMTDTAGNDYDGVTIAYIEELQEPPTLAEGAMLLGGLAAGTGALMMAGVAVPFLGPALMGGALLSYGQREQNWLTDEKYYLNEALEQKTVYVGETVQGSIFMPAVEFASITIAYSSADGSRRDRVQLRASAQDLGENAFTPALSRSAVREAQHLLNELGYEAGTPDGIVGNKTIAATKAFQENHGLVADGIIGRATLEKLEAESQQ